MNLIFLIELFDVCDIDFMVPFVSSHGIKNILVASRVGKHPEIMIQED